MKKSLLTGISSLCESALCMLFIFAGFAIHIWTVIIAVALKGTFAGIISLFLPVLAELFWSYAMIGKTGTFNNPYSLSVASFIGACLLVTLVSAASGTPASEDRLEGSS